MLRPMLDSPIHETLAHDAPLDEATAILRRTFGHAGFRGLQGEVIAEVLAGRHALAVLPTGGGKSLCYQIPAMMRPGVAIVISPLIALMADQVEGLVQSGVAAARLDSDTTLDERSAVWRRIEAGELDLLYLSPEGLMQPAMLDRLVRQKISLIAIDEAHCVSQWGHDFRPEYRMLGRVAELFPEVPRLATPAPGRTSAPSSGCRARRSSSRPSRGPNCACRPSASTAGPTSG
jgi:ATP-dependent DNA helicase RecQ